MWFIFSRSGCTPYKGYNIFISLYKSLLFNGWIVSSIIGSYVFKIFFYYFIVVKKFNFFYTSMVTLKKVRILEVSF